MLKGQITLKDLMKTLDHIYARWERDLQSRTTSSLQVKMVCFVLTEEEAEYFIPVMEEKNVITGLDYKET